MKFTKRLRTIFLGFTLAASFTLPAWGELDMQFWKSPGYFDDYFAEVTATANPMPSITSEEEEIMKTANGFGENRSAEAIRFIERSLTPESSAALNYYLGALYMKEDASDKALKQFQLALQKHPQFQAVYKYMGFIHLQNENWERAAYFLNKNIEFGDYDARTYGLLGMVYLRQDKIVESETAYKKAIIADPTNLDWYKGLASTLIRQEKNLELVPLFEEMIAMQPEKVDFLLLQANSFIALEKPLNAAANYEIVRRMDQATSDSMSLLGDIYLNENQIEMATEAYVESIALDSKPETASKGDNVKRSIQSCGVLIQRGFWDEGEQLIRTVRKYYNDQLEEKQDLDLLRLEARIAIARGDTQRSINILEQVVERDPEDGQNLLLLAQTHLTMAMEKASENGEDYADIEVARSYYERAIKIEDDDFRYRALVQYAQMLVQNKLYCDAVPLLQAALDINYSENVQEYRDRVDQFCRRLRLNG